MGVVRGGQEGKSPWILIIAAKKCCLLSFELEKRNFTTFGPPLEKYWKNPPSALLESP